MNGHDKFNQVLSLLISIYMKKIVIVSKTIFIKYFFCIFIYLQNIVEWKNQNVTISRNLGNFLWHLEYIVLDKKNQANLINSELQI